MTPSAKPLLPLVCANVPTSLLSLLSQEGISTVAFTKEPAAGRFVLGDSTLGPSPRVAPDQFLIDVAVLRRSSAHDPFRDLELASSCRTAWKVGEWTAYEEIAAIDRAEVCRNVIAELRRQIESLGGVWLRVRPVPSPYRTAFSFRFDHDAYVPADFTAVMDAISGREQMTTHYVCAATHEWHDRALRRLRDCDVGSHGYRHHTYRDPLQNLQNVAKGIVTLRTLGFEPSGFAAPHGRSCATIAAGLQAMGVTHGSEFAVGYDDWPFFPDANDVLQMPIHPVCLGIVLEAARSQEPDCATLRSRVAAVVSDHFLAAAEAKRAAGEPLFFYGHPDGRLGRHVHVLTELLDQAAGWGDVWKTNFTEFQQWWRARAAVRTTVLPHENGYEVRVAGLPARWKCALEWIAGVTHVVYQAEPTRLRMGREQLQPLSPVLVPRPRPLAQVVNRDLRSRLHRALDWEYETPVAEIGTATWRGRLKRSLRRWKERRT